MSIWKQSALNVHFGDQSERAKLEWMSKVSVSAAEASAAGDRCAQLRKLLTDQVAKLCSSEPLRDRVCLLVVIRNRYSSRYRESYAQFRQELMALPAYGDILSR